LISETTQANTSNMERKQGFRLLLRTLLEVLWRLASQELVRLQPRDQPIKPRPHRVQVPRSHQHLSLLFGPCLYFLEDRHDSIVLVSSKMGYRNCLIVGAVLTVFPEDN
jgi:hypothetical protein